jgi:hypothetical protein
MQHPKERWGKFCFTSLTKCEVLKANNIPRDDEEGADILDMGFVGGNQHNEPNNGDDAEGYHVWPTLLGPVCQESSGDSNDTTDNVGRNAHQLRLVVGVAHVLDDGREEERNRVKRCVDTYKCTRFSMILRLFARRITNGGQHVDIDLPVLEGVE